MWTSSASFYFANRKLMQLFLYYFPVPCIILSSVYFYIVRSMFHFLFSWSQSKGSVSYQTSHLFLKVKIFFCYFQLFENGHIHNVVLTLIIAMELDVENNKIVYALPNVVNINVEIDSLDLMLFNIVNLNVDILNVVSTLIWPCTTSRRHINLTTTLR